MVSRYFEFVLGGICGSAGLFPAPLVGSSWAGASVIHQLQSVNVLVQRRNLRWAVQRLCRLTFGIESPFPLVPGESEVLGHMFDCLECWKP